MGPVGTVWSFYVKTALYVTTAIKSLLLVLSVTLRRREVTQNMVVDDVIESGRCVH